ncbi:VanZ family protein [Nocardioidaceae bacterium]|nr:VanZ family protein [Nocardioidaceae bacterium]
MSALSYVPLELLLLAVVAGCAAAYAVARPAWLRGDPYSAVARASRVLLLGAIAAVLVVTLTGGEPGGAANGVNLMPGDGIRRALLNSNRDLGLLNLAGNVVMFVPVALLLPVATGLRWRHCVSLCVLGSLAIETAQLSLGRAFDIDDVLLNGVGALLGAALGVVVAGGFRRARRRDAHRQRS